MRQYKFIILLLVLQVIRPQNSLPDSPRSLEASSLSSPAISTSRSTQLGQQCGPLSRNSLLDAYNSQAGFQYSASFSALFPLDQTVFDNFLQLDLAAINSNLKTHTAGYLLLVMLPPAVLVLLLLAAPVMHVLLFCPFDSCLRNKLEYSRCEQLWPAAVVLFLGLALMGGSAVGMLSQHQWWEGYREVGCSGTMLFDDALNGNAKSDGSSFFTGTANIAKTSRLLAENHKQVYGNISQVPTSSSLLSQAEGDVGNIPNPNGDLFSIHYPTPLLAQVTTHSIPSTFPDALGTKQRPDSLVGKSTAALNKTRSSLDSIAAKADIFLMTQPYSQDLLYQLSREANETSSDLFQGLLQIDDLFSTHAPPAYAQHLETIVYGSLMALVALLLFSQLCLLKWSRMWCRHFIYILGFFLFFATLAVLAVSLILALASAVSYSGCNYFNQSISSPHNFESTSVVTEGSLSRMGVGTSGSQLLSTCLDGQSGDFIATMSGQPTSEYLGTASTFMGEFANFDPKVEVSAIDREYLSLQQSIFSYSRSEVIDIEEEASIKDLTFVSNAANYPGCRLGHFQEDSWVPNIHQQGNSIPCTFSSASSFSSADSSTCPSALAFRTALAGCTGCMDSFSLLNNQTSKSTTMDYLQARYSDCPSFNNHLSNLWTNFYLVKKQSFQPVLQREVVARQSVSNTKQHLSTTLDPLISSTVANLYLASDWGLDPKYGALAGLNCQVLGEDIILFKSVLCHNTFSYSYFHCVLLLVLGLCLAFLLCCNTCVLFRQKKEIFNAVNWPEDEGRVRAEMVPQTAGRLNPYS